MVEPSKSKVVELIEKAKSDKNDLQAIAWLEEALAIAKTGNFSYEESTIVNAQAERHQNLERFDEALMLYERALVVREQALGPNHPATARSLTKLATLYRRLGKYTKALPLYKHALAICEKVQGPDHPITKSVRENYLL